MNKYLAIFSFVALCISLSEAATNIEVQRTMHDSIQKTRALVNVALRTAERDALLSATTPQQKTCITTKIGPAHRDINIAMNSQVVALEQQYGNLTPEQLASVDVIALGEDVAQSLSSVVSIARDWVNQISQCA